MVVVLVALLAAIAIPTLVRHRETSWRAAVESDLRNAATEIHAAGTSSGSYPTVVPATVRTSPQVTIVAGAAASGSRICLKGDHAGLSESIYFDSSAGGVTTVAC